jgi:pyridinium-3,5-biscarboxylic acid mononucleotide sulfurtransferase
MAMQTQTSQLMDSSLVAEKAKQLVEFVQQFESCAVAFSGGVDSAVVAQSAFLAKTVQSVAITGLGAAVSQVDQTDAVDIATAIGIRHVQIATTELENPAYAANDSQRCFYCKSELYRKMRVWCDANNFKTILSGTNSDDLSDYRPGLRAATDFGVQSPLAVLGFGKADVRQLAEFWKIRIANKPASPCLASRIAYGQVVSIERLTKIEKGERWLARNGFRDVRVRLHADDMARIELHLDELSRLTDEPMRSEMVQAFRDFGFAFVTVDLNGRESGSLNRTLELQSPKRS